MDFWIGLVSENGESRMEQPNGGTTPSKQIRPIKHMVVADAGS